MKIVRPKIEDEATATRFVVACVEGLGPGYHPDTPFREYLSDDGTRCFSDDEARSLDEATEVAFRYCDPYCIALEAAQRLLAK